jgi:hypothetical protein
MNGRHATNTGRNFLQMQGFLQERGYVYPHGVSGHRDGGIVRRLRALDRQSQRLGAHPPISPESGVARTVPFGLVSAA